MGRFSEHTAGSRSDTVPVTLNVNTNFNTNVYTNVYTNFRAGVSLLLTFAGLRMDYEVRSLA